jgi:hypothetical protein
MNEDNSGKDELSHPTPTPSTDDDCTDNGYDKIERLVCSLKNEQLRRFDALMRENECLRRENREILSAIEEMKTKIEEIREVVNPAPIWKVMVDYPDVFEKHVLTKLNGTDLKFFYGTNTDTRLAIKRANIKLQQ